MWGILKLCWCREWGFIVKNILEEKLAIDGGEPIRNNGLPSAFPGAFVYGKEELHSICEVIENKSPFRYYGPNVVGKVKKFEKAISEKIGSKHSLGVTSGTASLIVALKALGIGPGDKVVVPANTFLATAGAVIIAGAVPIFADIDESFNIDPDCIEKCIDKYTKAIIAVPILGNPCQMDKILAVAKKHNLFVIEDVAQSCGSKFQEKYSGTFGNIGCFSFQINKIITTGDGGCVVINDDNTYQRAVRYHDHGMFRESEGFLTSDSSNVFIGQNYRMSELTGAVALEQVKKLDIIIDTLKKTKKSIKNEIKQISGINFRKIIDEDGDASNALVLMFPDKEITSKFSKCLEAENIGAYPLYGGRPVYMIPQILYKKTIDKDNFPFNQFDHNIDYFEGLCPNAERLLPCSLLIMLGTSFTQKDTEDISNAIKKVARNIL